MDDRVWSEPPAGTPTAELARLLESASFGFSLLMLVALVVSLAFRGLAPVSVLGCLGLSAMGLRLARVEPPPSWLPTAITALRAAITGWLAAFGLVLAGWEVAAVVLVVFALDWVDGHLARRTNSVSTLGGHLDGETDAMLTAVVCTLLYLRGPFGPWVLVGGSLRYLYVLTVRFVPSRGLVPRSKFAARAFGIALMGLTLGFLPLGPVAHVAPAIATLLLVWSFGRTFYWSFRGAS